MLNQLKEVLCFSVAFQGSRDTIKEEPKVNIYDMFISHGNIF